MANMSYCRFENTSYDLQDVEDVWADDADLSSAELRGKARILKSIIRILEAEGVEFDVEALEEEAKSLRERSR